MLLSRKPKRPPEETQHERLALVYLAVEEPVTVRLRQLVQEATPGKWIYWLGAVYAGDVTVCDANTSPRVDENAELIALAPDLAAWAIDAADYLRDVGPLIEGVPGRESQRRAALLARLDSIGAQQ